MRFGFRPWLLLCAAVLLAGLAAPLPSAAQGLPPGSYQRSCWNIQVYGGTLFAECLRPDQSRHHTEMPRFWECHGDIANIEGHLRCVVREERPRLPGGSYLETCWEARVMDGVLYAQCRRRDGSVRATDLPNAWYCHGNIINENGHLRCLLW